MSATKIEWADRVWNPITGCTPVSAGCKNCYAEQYANRFWKGRKFGDVKFHFERFSQPCYWKPCRIFVNSMGDIFHPNVDTESIDHILHIISICHRHTFIVLTKRPELMQEKLYGGNGARVLGGGDYLPNLWLGVSVENQETADKRIPELLKIPAAKRVVSYEPALGAVNFRPFDDFSDTGHGRRWLGKSSNAANSQGIDWLIAGGETGPGARPSHPDWFRSARDQCVAAGVSFFFKQWGEYVDIDDAIKRLNYNPYGNELKKIFIKGHSLPLVRVGKRLAGRLLDGKEWNQIPEVSCQHG